MIAACCWCSIRIFRAGLIATAAETDCDERFERAMTLCAGLTWHFYERNAQLQFRSAGIETRLAPAEEIVFLILRYLAVAESEAAGLRSMT